MKKWTLKTKTQNAESIVGNGYTISKEVAQIMKNRDVLGKDLEMYIKPNIEFLRDPFLLKDMDKATNRIKSAIENKEIIYIYGDYDVDGVSSTSILVLYFDSIGYEVNYYIPNRLEEGYGLNIDAIDELKANGAELIITVDCGITSVREVDYANELGIDVIVTDHHECQEKLPNALAVIDPKREDCSYPFKGICGCGVALKLIHALSGDAFFADVERYLEIASIATICDIMPVLDENRIIVKNGLELMMRSNNIGVKALMDVCELSGNKIKSSHIGFSIGPRINACGRLGYSNLGVKLFTSKNYEDALQLAQAMNRLNEERQAIESNISNEAEKLIRDNPNFENEKVMVLASEGWHHGIIGIVASKLTEKYYKPSILLCLEDGMATGSARSIKGFDLFDALFQCKELMTKFGGHEQAAGLTISEENIDKLRHQINEIADYNLIEEDLIEEIKIEYEINSSSINLNLVDELHVLEPFGIKNPTPYFVMRDCLVKNAYLIGQDKKHLKLVIEKDVSFDCVGFNMAHLRSEFDVDDTIDIVFQIDENTFNGNTKVQLLIKDIRLCRTSSPEKYSNLLSGYIKNKENFITEENSIDTNVEVESSDLLNIDLMKMKSMTTSRINNVISLIDKNTLIVVNTLNGYMRAMSDIGVCGEEKIELIFASNIDKSSIKVYNKIIIYDFLNSISELHCLYQNKKKEAELLFNFCKDDFIYLLREYNEKLFDRNNFANAYKYFTNIDTAELRLEDILLNLRVSLQSIFNILKVFKSESFLNYDYNLNDNTVKIQMLPRPSKKIDLEQNSIVIRNNNKLDEFKRTYGI